MAGLKIGQLIYTNSSDAFLWPSSVNGGGLLVGKDQPLLLLGIKRKALYYEVLWDEKAWLIGISWIKTKRPRVDAQAWARKRAHGTCFIKSK